MHRVDDSGVVTPSKGTTNGRERGVRELAAQVHRHLAWPHHALGAAVAHELLERDPVVARGGLLHQVDTHSASACGKQIHQYFLRQLNGHGPAGDRGVRNDADERALELSHVGGDPRGDIRERLGVADLVTVGHHPLAQNGDTQFDVGRLHIGDESHLKARAQPVFQRLNGARGPVAGDHDLLAALL